MHFDSDHGFNHRGILFINELFLEEWAEAGISDCLSTPSSSLLPSKQNPPLVSYPSLPHDLMCLRRRKATPPPAPGVVLAITASKWAWDSRQDNFIWGKVYRGLSITILPCSGKYLEVTIYSFSRHCCTWIWRPNCRKQVQKKTNPMWRALPREEEWSRIPG